jgi:pimeloyl-ACP methyl ester carboxylesterase
MHANLLILPGLLEDADAFEELISGMQEVATCIVADLTRAETVADLARSALEQAPEGRFALAGHSMGGYVALEIMRQAPERISRLALLNTHARPDSAEATQNRRRLMELADRDFEAVVSALLPKLMTGEHLKDPVLTGIVGAMALATGREAFQRQERAIIGRPDSRPHLAAIRCPTLVVAGRDDQLMPVELLEELARGIPGARLAVVEECGHLATIEQPFEVTRLVREWLTG